MYGHALLATIHSLPVETHAAAILRHAERYPITDSTRPELAELKPSGIEAATAFGKTLKGFDRVLVFHSPVKRCQQTAEAIADGLSQSKIDATVMGPRVALGVDYIRDTLEAGRLGGALGETFIRRWFDGQVAPTVVRPPSEVGALHRDFIARSLAETPQIGRCLNLHVTHDWNILALREWMVGVRHEEAGWIDFLDGLAFTPASSGGLKAHCPARPDTLCRFSR